jgi:hypothetical protein
MAGCFSASGHFLKSLNFPLFLSHLEFPQKLIVVFYRVIVQSHYPYMLDESKFRTLERNS